MKTDELTKHNKSNFCVLKTKHIFSAARDYSLILKADLPYRKLVSGNRVAALISTVFTLYRPRDVWCWIARC